MKRFTENTVGNCLTLGDLAYQYLTLIVPRHDRRRRARALLIGDDYRLLAFHYRHHAIGGSKIDSDCLAHC
jgi:hypothetical protein